MDNNVYLVILVLVGSFAAGFILSALYSKVTFGKRLKDDKNKAQKLILEAKREAESIKKEAELTAKDRVIQAKSEAERELKERRIELNQLDKRLRHRDEILDRKLEQSDKREHNFNKKEKEINRRERELTEKELKCEKLFQLQTESLERIAGLSREEAKKEFLKRVEEESKFDAAKVAKRIEDEAVETANRKAKEILSFILIIFQSFTEGDFTV